jgi:hypothetical protein
MNIESFGKGNADTAVEICARLDLDKEAEALLCDGIGPREFVEALSTNKEYFAGIDFIAHALTPREAVWWGCLCLQHACGSGLSSQEKAACKAAVKWVLEPTEANRAAAKVPAEALGPGSAAGALAAAANKTGGNLVRDIVPPLPAGPFAPAKAVAGAVKLASTKVDPIKIVDTQRLFVELGIGVAEGRFVWPEFRSGAKVRRSQRED